MATLDLHVNLTHYFIFLGHLECLRESLSNVRHQSKSSEKSNGTIHSHTICKK